MRSYFIGTLGLLLVSGGAFAQPELVRDPYHEAEELERRGQDKEAFLKYLQVPGAEHAALKLARPKAKEYLEVVRTQGKKLPFARFKLIEGELLLASGARDEALECYRAVADKIGTTSKQNWDHGFLPRDHYFIEVPTLSPRDDAYAYGAVIHQAQQPFVLGPGSHRDNMLLRRFLALEAWDDAGREYARLWDFHVRYSEAYVTSAMEQDPAQPKTWKRRDYVVQESGFSGLGLFFSLDYAFYWKQRKDNDKALATLREALLRVRLDDYHDAWESVPLDPDDGREYPREIGGGFGHGFKYSYGGAQATGITAKEFLRLAYGEFKTAGQEARLAEALEREIKLGKNRLRRVLARIRLHEGKPDEALALELSYLKAARLSELVRAQRRGKIFEDFQKLAAAAGEYEKTLGALPKKLDQEHERLRDDSLARLLSLYASLGQTQKLLDLSLRQFDLGHPLSVAALEQALQIYQKAGQEAKFTAWLKERRDQVKDSWDRANLSWLLKDYPATLAALADVARRGQRYGWQDQAAWEERFRKLNMERDFLKVVPATRPQDLESRWRLLVLENRTKGPEAIELMELMLEAATKQQGYVATPKYVYPLLRLYEQHGHLDKLVRLGRQIMEGKTPFQDVEREHYGPQYQGVHGYEEQQILADSLFLILPHLKDDQDLQTFKKVAERWNRYDLVNQLARRQHGDKAARKDQFTGRVRDYANVIVQTVGLPAGVRMLTARDDVRAISPDGQWIGTSWGLVRYRETAKDSLEILQVPLGSEVNEILDTPAGMFVGTSGGLVRLDEPNGTKPSPVHIPVHTPAYALTWWKDQVWVEFPRSIVQYDPKSQTLVVHDDPDRWNGGAWQRRLVVADGKLWTGRAFFNEKTGEFQEIHHDGEFQILGGAGGQIWASVTLPRFGNRPALLDQKSGSLKVLPIANIKPNESHSFDAILGADKEHVWFGGSSLLVYRQQTGLVHVVRPPEQDEKRNHLGPAFWYRNYGRPARIYVDTARHEYVSGLHSYRPTGWKEVTGRILAGAAKPDSNVDDGGLFAVDPKTLQWSKLGHPASELAHVRVNKIVFDDDANKAYVCTDGGLTILSLPEGNVAGRITVSDGLPSNRITDVVRVGEKLCIACGPFRVEGGLALFDPKTGRIERFTKLDGLPSFHIKKLRVEGDKVHVLFDTFLPSASWQHHHDRTGTIPVGEQITVKSVILDLKANKIVAGDEILKPSPGPKSLLPILGGMLTVDVTHEGKRYLGGGHGLLILDDPKLSLTATSPTLALKRIPTRTQRWETEAKERQLVVRTPEDLIKLLGEENPFLRAKAMEALPTKVGADYVVALQRALADKQAPVRQKAVVLLKELASPQIIDIVKPLLKDADSVVRANAAVALAKAKDLPDLKYFEEILNVERSPVPLKEVYEVLAPECSIKTFGMILKFPLLRYPYPDEGQTPAFIQVLGSRVRQLPELADMLLQAYDPDPEELMDRPRRDPVSQVAFAAQVFKAAGKPILPLLEKALRSPDRVIRSNAARACGAIGDPAAVPHLVKALDLESGLARASIVDALGQLKAKDALPVLIKLYVDAVNDDWAWGSTSVQHSGAGFRSSQMGVSMAAMYEHLSDLDALKASWEDLKSAARRPPRDPRRHENLLTAEHLLKAIRDIGPEHAPEFYRALAGDKDGKLRHEAAIHLAHAGPSDLEKNLPILRNLAADPQPDVQMAATVTLHILKQPGTEKAIDSWLTSSEYELKRQILVALDRVEEGERLSFARARLQAIAADTTLHDWLRGRAEYLLHRSQTKKK